MESNPSYATSVQTDASGNWQHVIPNNLSAGIHHVIVQDEQGNEQTLLLYVDRASSTTSATIHTKSKTIHSDQLSFAMVGLIIGLGLALFGFFIRSLILKGKVTTSPKRK